MHIYLKKSTHTHIYKYRHMHKKLLLQVNIFSSSHSPWPPYYIYILNDEG